MSLLEKTKHALRNNRIVPNKLLGQNFTVDEEIFERLSEHVSLSEEDVALDIGAGLGFLTRFLAERCSQVLAVESDPNLVRILHERLADLGNVNVIQGNILKLDVSGFNKIVSIPPYQISSRLMLWLFGKHLDSAVMVFQKEFANRLVASVGSEDYGWLTVLSYFYLECELFEEVPRTSFFPQPEIDSTIVRLLPRREPPFDVSNRDSFTKLIRSLFTQRNRKVRNAALPLLKTGKPSITADIKAMALKLPFRDRRVRELAPEDFGELADALT